MMRLLSIPAMVLMFGIVASGCDRRVGTEDAHDEHATHDEMKLEGERGPRGGRLFHAGERAVEIAVNDEGPAPTMQAWLYDGEMKVVRPGAESLAVDLTRFNGSVDRVTFRVDGDHFHSEQAIVEPHSYAAEIRLTAAGKTQAWRFEQEEGRIELALQAAINAGIEVAPAGAARLSILEESPGEVKLNRERVLLVTPRYAGTLRELRKRLGDAVRAGETVAIIQSNESLADYAVVSRIAGTVIGQGATPGQTVHQEEEILTVADLSEVWVDFPIYSRNQGRVRPGLPAIVRASAPGGAEATGTVRYVGPVLEQETRVSMGRIVLPNRDRRWQPGMYVDVKVAVDEVDVLITVPEEAIVRMGTGEAVFRARSGGAFESQPVRTGRRDAYRTEILEGLAAGDTIVVRNAFLLKAELGKSEAKHDH